MVNVVEEAGRLAAAPMRDDTSGKETTFASRNIRKWRLFRNHCFGQFQIGIRYSWRRRCLN